MAENDTPDLQQIHDVLVEIAEKAGKMITSAVPSTSDSGTKKNCMSRTSA